MSEKANKPKIGIIVGSNLPTRICRTVAEWAMEAMRDERIDLELIDLAEIALPFLDEPEIPARHKSQKGHTETWSRTISG